MEGNSEQDRIKLEIARLTATHGGNIHYKAIAIINQGYDYDTGIDVSEASL